MTEGGTAVLTDFGISRVVSRTAGVVNQTSVAGTFNFMPPEQVMPFCWGGRSMRGLMRGLVRIKTCFNCCVLCCTVRDRCLRWHQVRHVGPGLYPDPHGLWEATLGGDEHDADLHKGARFSTFVAYFEEARPAVYMPSGDAR